MNDETKKQIQERYQRELNKGEFFWPDSIFKDALVALGVLILLVLLAAFLGVAGDPKADPSDTSYIPRPEWYFLFLFKFLALYGQIPVIGKIEWLATVLIPGMGIGLLTLLPLFDRSPFRHYSRRVFALATMGTVILDIVLLTVVSGLPAAPTAEELAVSTTLQAIGGLWIPVAVLALLVGLYVLGRGVYRGSTRRSIPLLITGAGAIAMVAMTTVVTLRAASYPKPEEISVANTLVEQIVAGQELYAANCTECHGDEGKVTKIEGVKGLEGKAIPAINSHDVLYTLDDAAVAEVIAYGRPEAGMTPFGKTYSGPLSKSEIDYIVMFMRYTWDDRFELPAEALKPVFPALAGGEVPSYDVHVQPIVKRYCLSCHRAGKENNNYLMDSYDSILHSGDQKDKNVVAGDPKSYLLQVIQGTAIPDPKDPSKVLIRTMPPNSHLKPDVVDAWMRWIINGMPKTTEEAARLSVTPTPRTGAAGTPAVTATP